jgi:nucleoside-diphosphate-sugar epimerase
MIGRVPDEQTWFLRRSSKHAISVSPQCSATSINDGKAINRQSDRAVSIDRGLIQNFVVTGGNGYIGRRFVCIALTRGYRVTVLGRSDAGIPQTASFVRWQLGAELPDLGLPAQATAIIHLAHDWASLDQDNINLRGTKILLKGARARGFRRFLFVSSVSARADPPNSYGRTKWDIEQILDGPDTVTARVGLVYGGPRRGMFGLLMRLVSLTPVLPMVSPSRLVQPIHVDEVCMGLIGLAESPATGWKGLAGAVPITFAEFLGKLAQEGLAVSLKILPVPLSLALAVAKLSARLPFAPRIDQERILGLAGTALLDCRVDLENIDLHIRPVREGLRHDPNGRKALLREGRVLCSYVLGRPAGNALVRRYLRAIRAVEGEVGPIALPRFSIWRPNLLRFFEPLRSDLTLARRLRIAAALAEFSTEGVESLDRFSSSNRLVKLLSIVSQLTLDIIAFPFRLWFTKTSPSQMS